MFFRIAAKDRRRGESRRAEDRRRRRLRPTLLVLEERKLLSGIVVNNPTDTPVTGEIDLRQAIGMANMNGGIETITFDSTVFGTAQTIELASGQLELSDTTGTETITGPSGGLTISGGNASRVFQVDEGVTASITGLTISGGQAAGNGGGVNNSGTLTLTDCTVSGNTAVYGAGTALGGGIYNNGTLTLTGSTITANRASGYYFASFGGGLFNSGTLTVTGSTIAANFALFTGGGGIWNSGGTATLTDTIVAGNTAGSRVFDLNGTVAGAYDLIGADSGEPVNGVDGNLVGVADPELGTLGNYGGPTETIPLLPGSPAIDAGTSAGAPATDQRGEPRVGAVDIGAFESQGFTMTPVAGSTPQAAAIGAAFADPLAVAVTANNPVEPVDGGVVGFVADPAANGASAILLAPSAVIAGGQAGVTGGPNDVDGSYTVTASGPGLAPASFALTNTGPVFTKLVVNATSGAFFAGAGLLTLPLAVDFANADRSGNAKIRFDPGVFGASQTITLTGAQLELSNTSEAETITGPAAGVTVSGGGLSGVFQVDKGVIASFSGLTITGGNTAGNGGGLYNDGGTVTLTDCTVSGNSSTLSSVAGGGGGVATASGTTTLYDCTVSGNSAARDGGGLIVLGGTMTLFNCTVVGNSSVFDGGGVSTLGGTMTLADCTVTGNSIVANFGGGVANYGGTATLTDTIVAENSSSSSPNDIGGTVAGTHDLIGTGGSGGLVDGVDGNLVGVADPGLGTLGDYGGPTETIPLLPGSPAIDAGTPAGAPAADQRGEPRFGAVDIGAFESQGFKTAQVAGSTPQAVVIGAAFIPLAVAVTANNPVEPVDGGVVRFAAGPAANGASAILLAPSAVIAGGQASVIGGPNNVDGSYTVTASAQGLAPVSFALTNTGAVRTKLVVNATSNGFFAGPGLLSLREAVAFANTDSSGNANISFDPRVFRAPQTITLTGAPLELSNTSEAETITGPAAGVTISGGGLSQVLLVDKAVQARVSGLAFVDGIATYGGAVANLGRLDMVNCRFEDNVTMPAIARSGGFVFSLQGGGAAIANEAGATLTMTGCTLTGNSTSDGGGSGGAILNQGTAALIDCSLSGNIAPDGGAIMNAGGTLALIGCRLEDNTAPPVNFSYGGTGASGPSSGGAILNSNGRLSLVDCTLTGNSANDGGAIDNQASYGVSALSLIDCTLSGNTAVVYDGFNIQQPAGGAIANLASAGGQATLSLIGCKLTGNTAGTGGGYGGALSSYGSSSGGEATVSLKDCTLKGNATGGTGGAVYAASGTLIMDGCTIAGNSAGQTGGGASISGTATLSNCTIRGNTSQDGGGVAVYGTSQLSMSACTVSGNTATGKGGGLYVQGLVVTYGYFGTYTSGPASLTLSAVTVSGNSAAQGGGIFNAGTVTATNITLRGNSAATGGGIDNVAGATATISGSTIANNVASGEGGGVANAGTITLTDTGIRGNTASGEGGGVYNSGTAALVDCQVSGNSAASGGGIYAVPGGTVTLTGTQVIHNKKNDIVGTVTEA